MSTVANRRPSTVNRARERSQRLTKRDRRDVEASFDLTRTTHENKRHWADADALSGRSSYNSSDRRTARMRSRLEAANNSWYAGMLRTASNHIIGAGPRLQVMTADNAFNRRVERGWNKWTRATSLISRLRMMVETYWRDGDCYLIRGHRASLRPITLDVRFYEAEQCARPYNRGLDPSLEDGIRVDRSGNPIEYWFLDNHPGDVSVGHINFLDGAWYDAEDVIHLFRADRPGQLTGFPRCAPALDWLAHLRRFSKATLSTAEAAALWGIFVKTTGSNVVSARMPTDFMSVEFERNAVNFMPEGWEPTAIDVKHPAPSNESYQRTELTYFCRCSGMPYSLAAGTSRDSNFASAKMDIKNTWEPEVKAEQSHIDITVMATIFRWFLEDMAISTDILDDAGLLDEIDYQFFWPPLPVSDEGDLAAARAERLKTGQSTFSSEAAEQGLDDDMLCQAAARDNNVSVEEYKRARFNATFGIQAQPVPAGQKANVAKAQQKKLLAENKRLKRKLRDALPRPELLTTGGAT